MTAPGYFDLQNQANIARWRCRWYAQGGTLLWPAHDLPDWRDEAGRRRHLALRVAMAMARGKLRQARESTTVANLWALRFRRQRAWARGAEVSVELRPGR